MATIACRVCGGDVRSFPSRPRIYCSARCYGTTLKGRRISPATEFQPGTRPSRATEFKSGRTAHNKGDGDRNCKTCGVRFGGRGRGRLYCSDRCTRSNPEWRERQAAAKRGRPSSRKGTRVTEEQRRRNSAARQGIAIEDWTGYSAPERRRLRRSADYRAWRQAVYERDGYRCQICERTGLYMHADHIVGWAVDETLRFDVSNGRSLCYECHYKVTFGYLDSEAALRWGVPAKYRRAVV